jgi:hypothetical protein
MIYTCYDMLRDCRADSPEGWSYFLSNYVPVVRKLLAHYFDSKPAMEGVLKALHDPESRLFSSLDEAPERLFVAELRQCVLAAVEAERRAAPPEIELDLEILGAALEPLTLVEKQVVWLETMRYRVPDTARMLRMDPGTVEKVRDRAAELIRGKVDHWRRSIITENGPLLGRAASSGIKENCLPAKAYLDVLDGRTTWQGRESLDRHAGACWACLDHFCRMVEVVDLLRGLQPLGAEEAESFKDMLGIETAKPPLWKRWLGAG